ncbi:hypothetical protein ABK040_009531 [Willaertia magna]
MSRPLKPEDFDSITEFLSDCESIGTSISELKEHLKKQGVSIRSLINFIKIENKRRGNPLMIGKESIMRSDDFPYLLGYHLPKTEFNRLTETELKKVLKDSKLDLEISFDEIIPNIEHLFEDEGILYERSPETNELIFSKVESGETGKKKKSEKKKSGKKKDKKEKKDKKKETIVKESKKGIIKDNQKEEKNNEIVKKVTEKTVTWDKDVQEEIRKEEMKEIEKKIEEPKSNKVEKQHEEKKEEREQKMEEKKEKEQKKEEPKILATDPPKRRRGRPRKNPEQPPKPKTTQEDDENLDKKRKRRIRKPISKRRKGEEIDEALADVFMNDICSICHKQTDICKETIISCCECAQNCHKSCINPSIPDFELDCWQCLNCKRCSVCFSEESSKDNDIYICSRCDRGWHHNCLEEGFRKQFSLDEDWYCPICSDMMGSCLTRTIIEESEEEESGCSSPVYDYNYLEKINN